MIERYQDSALDDIWGRLATVEEWFHIELMFARVYHNVDLCNYFDSHQVDFKWISARALELEQVNSHDVASFVQATHEYLAQAGVDRALISRSVHHYPITSSDVVDNALSFQILRSIDWLGFRWTQLKMAMEARIRADRGVEAVARTHGQHAVRIPFSRRWEQHLSELQEAFSRLQEFRLPLKLGGVVGTHPVDIDESGLHGWIEDRGIRLNLNVLCTQVVPRHYYAEVANQLSVLSSVIARLALTIRLLSQSEVREVREGRGREYKGSSVMPHKRNPIQCEQVSGMARMARAYAGALSESVELWHERDISHSCVERICWPDLFHVLSHQLTTMTSVISNLEVNQLVIQERADQLVDSAAQLANLTSKGLDREEAYRDIKSCN